MRTITAVFCWTVALAALIITATCLVMALGLALGSAAHGSPRQCHGIVGLASWYSAGRLTAEGRPYRPDAISAAHRSYRMGTMLRIVDQATGKAIVARVSDRGPFIRGRIVDLSRGAARQIGMIGRGVVRVCVSPVARGPPWRR